MPSSLHARQILLGIAAAILVAAGGIAYELRDTPSSDLSIGLPASTAASVPSAPGAASLRLLIPALQINAHVQEVGRSITGKMANPSNFRDVAWFREGTRPGKKGSAVIAGHLDNALGFAGVFKNLSTLKPGDNVYIESPTEGTIRFRVMRKEVYPYDQVPAHEVFSKNDGAYLNLVTCAGTWLPKLRTYDERLVVYAERVFENAGTAAASS